MPRHASLVFALVLTLPIAVPAPVAAQQVGRDFRRIGGWDVESVMDGGKFFGCRANFSTPNGHIGILRYAKGTWAVTTPSLPHPDGAKTTGVMNFGGLTQPFTIAVSKGSTREAIPIDANKLGRLRTASSIEVVVSGRRWAFPLVDVATAVGAVEDCWKLAGKGGAATTAAQPAAGSGGTGADTFVPYRTVGNWRVQTVWNADRTLDRCRAALATADGEIAIIVWPNGKWSIGIPHSGLKKGEKLSGSIEFNRASMPFTITASQDTSRPTIDADEGLREALTDGGQLSVVIGSTVRSWRLEQTASAMGATKDCARDAAQRAP